MRARTTQVHKNNNVIWGFRDANGKMRRKKEKKKTKTSVVRIIRMY